ncbi:MAG TPA: tRNA epoxyqueuosine(34) reductase QueG [Caldimonas sp.]|nr:tRNA epoxyqueuosine(34) reductase QueG [Caldimonas sp.]HEX4236167.1 tRNA epoxyqueuosine(34) reductase QueG [Caldimonas sp.]
MLEQLREWGRAFGFSQIGVAGIDLHTVEPGLAAWLDNGFHGEMDYMAVHGMKRARPAELVAGTLSVITARLDYLPPSTAPGWQAIEWDRLADPRAATISLYARGRDYHKVLRQRLRQLADRLAEAVGPVGHRVFTDSAPVLEVELAARSGIGWRGKHTLALDRDAGSMFFLGEIFVDVALPESPMVGAHCGTCSACIEICPTQAIVAPYTLDARRCISYLTIEHHGAIPVELRAAIGNRVYGCDDCQLVCPWNKYARTSPIADFDTRPALDAPTLLELWAWDEAAFLRISEGSAIRRIGFERWQRNVAVALGNAFAATGDPAIAAALAAQRDGASELVREHIDWALRQGERRAATAALPA